MELAGSDIEIKPVSKQRSRKSVSVPPPRTEIDAMSRRNRMPWRDRRAIFCGVRRGSAGARARQCFEGKSRLSL